MPATRFSLAGSAYLLRRGEAALSCNFGSTSSKQALAYLETRIDRVSLVRVPVDVGIDDPDRAESPFELAGVAALDGDSSFVLGRRSLTMDHHIPLKTLLTYTSSITNKKILKRLPGGGDLVHILSSAEVTASKIDDVLQQHFSILQRSALKQAKSQQGDAIKYQTASEGQAAAAYICSRFNDPNYQSLSAYFSQDRQLLNSMSNVPHGLVTGTQGGSDIANHIIRNIIKQKYLSLLAEQRPISKGDLADLMVNFDTKKKRFDYTDDQATLTLRGGNPVITITLTPAQAREPFERAFVNGVQLLKEQLRRMLALRRDFAVLFCGGSYCNPGLHNIVSNIIRDTREAGGKAGINIQHMFLRDEVYSTSAVSVGAAVGIMRLPRPIDVLKGSAIGLQEISRSKDCPPPLYVDIHVPGDARRWLKFFLVYDPNWASHLDTSPPPASTATPGSLMPASRQISIGSPETVLGGPASTYNLGFAIRPADIPKGDIRISLKRLAEDLNK
ncbi:hypothetical protein F5Y09DRAFT_342421 [Xylaria sp. FL1042]|nr:hypothetical protein F5Y09DRAFT_342421 [Xylaria sp. FL1042]